jgi:autotransporter-associated beta strand protein
VLTHANGFGTGPVALTNEVDGTNVHIMFRLGAGETTVANPIAVTPFSGLRSTFDVDSASSTTVLTGQITGGGPSDLVNNLTHTVLRLTGTNSATTGTVFKFANPTNSFQAIIEVATGNLAVADSAALGNSENPVRLANGSTTTRSGLRFDADFVGAGAFPRTVMMRSSSNINTQRFDVTLAGPVTDALIPPATVGNPPTTSTGTLTKIGTGTLTLANAANTHTGQVVVNEGSLSVVGNIAAGGTAANNVVNVNASGRLMGTGTVDRPVSVNAGGTLQGGTGGAAGTPTVGAITLDGANTLRTVVGGTGASPTFSRIAAGSNPLTFNAAGTATDLTTILLVGDGTLITDGTNTYTVTVATFTNGTPPPAANFVVAAEGFVFSGSPTLVVDGTSLVVTFTPVPEPGTVLALGAAGLGVAGLVRRRSRARCAETT